MKMNSTRRVLIAMGLALPLVLLGLRVFAQADFRYKFRRTTHKAEVIVAKCLGRQPRAVAISGRLIGTGAFKEALKGAQVTAVESTSGYDATTDSDGRFVLPHLIWFAGATYTIVVTADIHNVRRVIANAPETCPTNGVIEIGDLSFDEETEIAFEESPIRHIRHDGLNANYYKAVFERVTANNETHYERITAVCKYVASRHNPLENAWSFRSARQILERGAPHCSNLAFAMAAITCAGGYPTRTVHTSDNAQFIRTHVAVEVYYDDAWHLYDPTYGICFPNKVGGVASYRELRLTPELIDETAFRGIEESIVRAALEWMPNAYRSGIHQFYYVDESVFL